jgi:hypothetical protein
MRSFIICTTCQIVLKLQIKEDEIVRGCSTMGEKRGAAKFWGGNLMEMDHLRNLDEMK